MYKIKVNNRHDFEIDKQADGLLVNNVTVNADIATLNPTLYHIINNHASYNAEVVSFDRAAKTAEIKVNNNTYIVSAKDEFDILLDKMGMNNAATLRISDIKAPMPGLVLKVFAEEGAEVKKGDNLFVLEAMKMENIIKSPADVVVKAIKIKPGDKVEKGQILMIF
ncbi:acetyl-CoA carboxylase biotin carboxyl carrier protein subunit [Mucilaginibacter psychrotolerans]|uniref:Acetyl-CoA carboxylase biotin carboxyl carrier protein subunit n=1 Tax=Mucilaginibacter psychrotolerans TaxID=1524096 RepID=A0A4Y8S523_9SPHI|nr:acetyl-CoA carboxylase biotin carboxyl carrier protein subunit [Mucilaginibacter psychrotolerans]TFF33660.1 acetyl-CoA carboxylase biotin carboxyl carrier protein subunit [Mucilaginibacter psychrotolerans]